MRRRSDATLMGHVDKRDAHPPAKEVRRGGGAEWRGDGMRPRAATRFCFARRCDAAKMLSSRRHVALLRRYAICRAFFSPVLRHSAAAAYPRLLQYRWRCERRQCAEYLNTEYGWSGDLVETSG